MLNFFETSLNALEKINWYGETEFTCPIFGYDKDGTKYRG